MSVSSDTSSSRSNKKIHANTNTNVNNQNQNPNHSKKSKIKSNNTLIKQLAHPTSHDIRQHALQILIKWLLSDTHTVNELDMNKLWYGLYYMYWHADGFAVQQELAVELSHIVLKFKPTIHDTSSSTSSSSSSSTLNTRAVLYLHSGLLTLQREWSLLDRLRLDKFMNLFRKLLYTSFLLIIKHHFQHTYISSIIYEYHSMMMNYNPLKASRGLQLHLIDIYLDELQHALQESNNMILPSSSSSASDSDSKHPNPPILLSLIQPFLQYFYLNDTTDNSVCQRIVKNLFTPIYQYYLQNDKNNTEKQQYSNILSQMNVNDINSIIHEIDRIINKHQLSIVRRDMLYEIQEKLREVIEKMEGTGNTIDGTNTDDNDHDGVEEEWTAEDDIALQKAIDDELNENDDDEEVQQDSSESSEKE